MSVASIAAQISQHIAAVTGVFVPPSVILQHFAAENSVSPTAQNNYAGLMSGGSLSSFGSGKQFAHAYTTHYVIPDLQGAIRKGAVKRGQKLTAAQYAAALQYGGPHPYCASGCGSFYTAANGAAQGYPLATTNQATTLEPTGLSGSANQVLQDSATQNPTTVLGAVTGQNPPSNSAQQAAGNWLGLPSVNWSNIGVTVVIVLIALLVLAGLIFNKGGIVNG